MQKALVYSLTEPELLVLQDASFDDSELAPDEIVCQTLTTVISPGTEVAAYKGMQPLRPGKVYPRVVGYCNVARVIKSGGEWRQGDLVLTHQCHRSHFRTKSSKVLCKVPADFSRELAAATYLYQLGYNCLLKGSYVPGMRVAVIGLGILGLGAVDLVARFGGRVAAFSNQESTRSKAIEVGATAAYSKSANELFSQSMFANEKFDLVILTTNAWADLKLAGRIVRKGGAVCTLGFPGRGQSLPDENPLDTQYFYDSQISLIYCGFSPETIAAAWEIRFSVQRNCEYLLELIMLDQLHVRSLITHVVPYTELRNCYEQLASREDSTPLTFALEWDVA